MAISNNASFDIIPSKEKQEPNQKKQNTTSPPENLLPKSNYFEALIASLFSYDLDEQ